MVSKKRNLIIAIIALLFGLAGPGFAADTLPDRISDQSFWKLIATLSEDNGTFQSENLLSNEVEFSEIAARLKRTMKPGGVYLGVGPEQNFNYIAAMRPKIAFIIDIRRQNLLEHLMYKALFELSPDRSTFISRLFSRPLVEGLKEDLTAAELLDAYSELQPNTLEFQKNLRDLKDNLQRKQGVTLNSDDWQNLANVYAAFREFGPLIEYSSRGGGPSGRTFSPSYQRLMTDTDNAGREWSYLASDENYATVRELELRNLILPLTGDFGGPKAIRSVGQYLKDHGAVVSAFYVSNVEGYLFRGGDRLGNLNGGAERFYANAATLPLDGGSTFIRWLPRRSFNNREAPIVLASILGTIDDFAAGRLTAEDLLVPRGFVGGTVTGTLNADTRYRYATGWVGPVRFFFYLVAAASAFFIRYFVWSPLVESEGFASKKRVLYAVAWGLTGLALAVFFTVLMQLWIRYV